MQVYVPVRIYPTELVAYTHFVAVNHIVINSKLRLCQDVMSFNNSPAVPISS